MFYWINQRNKLLASASASLYDICMYLQSSRNRVSSTDFCGNLVKLDFEPDL